MEDEIRYFSMFTGVGGFELGLETTSNRNVRCSSQEENLPNPKGDKSIFERQQEGINNQSNIGKIESTQDTSRALFQNGQEQSNSKSRDMGEIERDIKSGQPLRQTSFGVLREGNGIRNDKEGMEQRESKPNTIKFKCIGFSEIDKYSSELLKQKFPEIKNYGDATKINPSELPDFDMLCGGFPCQAFSIAGKRRGFQDTRGTLFFDITRILEVKKPKIVFLENVKGLLNHNKGETFRVIIQTLSELGYNVQWMVLNSKFFGVPQNRERVFIIGSLRGEPRPEILPFRHSTKENPQPNEGKISSAISTEIPQHRNDGFYITHPTITEAIGRQGSSKEYMTNLKQVAQAQRIRDTEGVAQTLQGQAGGQGAKTGLYSVQSHSPRTNDPKKGGSGSLISKEHCFTLDRSPHYVHGDLRIRRLTPIECERLQGFPDNWTEGFSDTQRYKMMGNAVTVNVIKAIIEKLL